MITVQLNKTSIVLYSSIKELPIQRYRVMQNYMLQDSGIGNDMAAIDRHLQNCVLFLGSDKKEECKEEIINLRYSFYSLINGVDYKTKSFACLIKQIGNVVFDDISTDGLNATVKSLVEINPATQEIETIWVDVKKNLIAN